MLDAQEKLSAASNGLDSLKDAYEEFKDEDIGFVTAKTLESLPDAFKKLSGFNLFSQIVGDPTSGTEKIQSAFNDIVKQYLISQGTLDALVNASSHEVQSYIANLKQMGITNAEEIIAQTTAVLGEENDIINEATEEYYKTYVKYLESNNKADLEYLESVASKSGQLLSALGKSYSSDYDNWCELLQKEAQAYNNFVSALGGSLDKVSVPNAPYSEEGLSKAQAQAIIDDASGKNVLSVSDLSNVSEGDLLKRGLLFGSSTTSNISKYTQEQVQSAKAYLESVKMAENFKNTLKLDLSTISTDFTSSFSPDTSSSSSSSDKSPETFDWVETKLNNLTEALEKLKTKASDTYSTWSTRNTALQQAIAKTHESINLQAQAYQTYMNKANSVGLSDYYKRLIQNGAMDISTISDENLAEKISDYQEW